MAACCFLRQHAGFFAAADCAMLHVAVATFLCWHSRTDQLCSIVSILGLVRHTSGRFVTMTLCCTDKYALSAHFTFLHTALADNL